MGGKFTSECLSHLSYGQFGTSVLLKVLPHFLESSFRQLTAENFPRMHNLNVPNRIRQKIGRIGKASEQRLQVALELRDAEQSPELDFRTGE